MAGSMPTAADVSARDLSPEAAASKQAAESGDPVEVASETTPTERITAQPDGTFKLDASTTPVRARQGNAWVPIDTTLQSQPDHTIRPRAAAVDMTFSGGGSDPLATVTSDGKTYSITAPWTLPAPTVSGATATYPSVLPDVDLVVSAGADGFAENVVVKTREAAQNPQLAALRFPVALSGLTVKQLSSGGAALMDSTGRSLFTTGTALQWDSAPAEQASGLQKTNRDAASVATDDDATNDPTPGSRTTAMGVSIDNTAMTVTPDQAFLADADTVYPVVLDPQTTGNHLAGWTALWSNGTMASTSFWDTKHSLGVGYDAYVDNKKVRSLYQFDTHGVSGKQVLEATFTAEEVWSANCTPKNVDLWRTSSISQSTTWNKPPKWYTKVDNQSAAKGYSSACPGGNLSFNAKGAVAASAGQSSGTTTLGLRVSDADDDDPIAWKQFASPNDAIPTLSVTFVSAPEEPTNLRMSDPNVGCGTESHPSVIHDVTPTLAAAPKSSDGSQATLRPNFRVRTPGGVEIANGHPSAWTASGTSGTWTVSGLTDGATYHFQARSEYQYNWSGHSGSMYSEWSKYCYFTIDTTAPPKPVISPAAVKGIYLGCATPLDEDDCTAYGGVGVAGDFLISAGASDVLTYIYQLNGGRLVQKTFKSPTPSLTIEMTPDVRGVNELQVETLDAAGNRSSSGFFDFKVAAGAPAVDTWSFDEGTGTSAADSVGGHTATLGGGATWSSRARLGKSLITNGSTAYATAPATGLDSSHSFTVGGWADLVGSTQNSVIVSQTGTNGTSFALYYSASYKAWVFNRYTSDSATPTIVRSVSTATPVPGVWTHLLGVYDEQAQTIQLYVNGVPQGDPVSFTTPWKASGSLQIGRSKIGGEYSDYANSRIDEVNFWNRILADDEVADLQSMAVGPNTQARPALVADWELNETSGSTAADGTPYANTGTVGADATWVNDDTMGNVLQLGGSVNSYVNSPGATVDSQGDFTVSAWVRLNPDSLADTSTSHTVRVTGQSGSVRDSWGLWYSQAAGQSQGVWVFGRTSADTTTATTTTAPDDVVAGKLVDPGEWTMVTGVYDGAHAQMYLFVNGVPQNVSGSDGNTESIGKGTTFANPWQAKGDLSIGRGRTSNGSYGDATTGLVSKVKVWTGVMSPAAINQMYTDDYHITWPDE
ncbi:LamG domain-containing protein [Actinacidiphila alni]|uniref:LamG domain-containing protein n=1 Tax=Actinacidiphila alni TaxID=380248 RepID=UPI0011600D09|nr:LamG domain-containing protein [Actinacidiphila alni]